MSWDTEQGETARLHLALSPCTFCCYFGAQSLSITLPQGLPQIRLLWVLGDPSAVGNGACADPGVLGTSSGEEREDKSPPLKTQPSEKLPDPAQGGSTKHLWALGRSRLRHRWRRVIGLEQPGLKIERPLDDRRLKGV